jgi:hypothetical protein
MAFVIRKQNKKSPMQPEGHYLVEGGIDWLITGLTISASGIVSIQLHDPVRLDSQLKRICTIEELVLTLPEVTYKEV